MTRAAGRVNSPSASGAHGCGLLMNAFYGDAARPARSQFPIETLARTRACRRSPAFPRRARSNCAWLLGFQRDPDQAAAAPYIPTA